MHGHFIFTTLAVQKTCVGLWPTVIPVECITRLNYTEDTVTTKGELVIMGLGVLEGESICYPSNGNILL